MEAANPTKIALVFIIHTLSFSLYSMCKARRYSLVWLVAFVCKASAVTKLEVVTEDTQKKVESVVHIYREVMGLGS